MLILSETEPAVSPVRVLWNRLLRRRLLLVVALAALVAIQFTVIEVLGLTDPVAMPTTPRWTIVAAAVLVIGLVTTGRPASWRLIAVLVASLAMLAGSLLAIPHSILMIVIAGLELLTGASGPIDVQPSWPMTAAHLTNLIGGLVTIGWIIIEWRWSRSRCVSCGRVDAAVPANHGQRRLLPWLGVLAVIGALPYGLIKLGWGLGWRGGLTGQAFDQVGLASPGFGDTVLLTGLSVAVSVVMATGLSIRLVRWATLAVGLLGSVMLLPVGGTAVAMLVRMQLVGGHIGDQEIAPWAFLVIYLSFLFWGTALAALTVTYSRVTREPCRRHLVP